MTNSPLVCYTKLSPNKSSGRTLPIDTITIHCTAGHCSVESLGALFEKSARKASSNYGIDDDGRIGLYVNEEDRSWCSSNSQNDNRAVTIEVSSDSAAPYRVTGAAYKSLIFLVADVCRRNGIKKLLWEHDKSLVGKVYLQNITLHKWFSAKACPGAYLEERIFDIAAKVNCIL